MFWKLTKMPWAVSGRGGVLGDALVGLEHQVELADVGEVALAAAGAGHVVLPDKGHHLLLGHGLHVHVGAALLLKIVLNELVGPVTHLAGLAVDKGVVEGGHMAGGHPYLGVHQDSGVELLPPGPLHVVLQLHAQGAVVPGVGQAAVDLAAGIDEAPALAQGHDFFHGLFGVLHINTPFLGLSESRRIHASPVRGGPAHALLILWPCR